MDIESLYYNSSSTRRPTVGVGQAFAMSFAYSYRTMLELSKCIFGANNGNDVTKSVQSTPETEKK